MPSIGSFNVAPRYNVKLSSAADDCGPHNDSITQKRNASSVAGGFLRVLRAGVLHYEDRIDNELTALTRAEENNRTRREPLQGWL